MLTKKLKNKKPIFYIKLAVAAVLVCAVLTASIVNSLWKKSDFLSHRDDIIHLDVRCVAKAQPLENVTLDLYIGYSNKKSSHSYRPPAHYIEVYYLCSLQTRLDLDTQSEHEVIDYKNVDDHYFLMEIRSVDAYTLPQYKYKTNIFGKVSYESYETITIPRSILEEYSTLEKYKNSFVIRRVLVHPTDQNTYTWLGGVTSQRIDYEIVERDQVILYPNVSQLPS